MMLDPSEMIMPALTVDILEACQDAYEAGCAPDAVARACYEAIDAWYANHPPQKVN
jgi:hypothetical protein